MPIPTVVSLFCGCGGLDLGFKQQGFDLLYAADHDPHSVDVYRRNIDKNAVVRDVASDEFHDDIASIKSCDVVLGGLPCQGFSKAGPKQQADERNTLYVEMRRAVEVLEPSIFIAENVDGMKQNFGGQFVEQIVSDFGELGYTVEMAILDAVAYGVPQHRRRIFFVGTRNGTHARFSWPAPTHHARVRNGEFAIAGADKKPKRLRPPRTVRDAIANLPALGDLPDHRIVRKWPKTYDHIMRAIGPGQKLCNVRFASTSVYTWQIPEAFGPVTARQVLILETIARHRRHKKYGNIPNGNPLPVDEIGALAGVRINRADIEALLKKNYLKEKNGMYDLKGAMFCSGLFKRPRWDEPSPTVLTNFHSPRYFMHPDDPRPFSLRECARLQGFDDTFVFADDESTRSLLAGYRLVGNAVPPPLSTTFAMSVQAYLQQLNAEAA